MNPIIRDKSCKKRNVVGVIKTDRMAGCALTLSYVKEVEGSLTAEANKMIESDETSTEIQGSEPANGRNNTKK